MENMNNLEKEILDIAEQVEKELEAGGLTSGIYLNWLQEVCKRVVEIEMHRVRKQVDQEIEKAREEGDIASDFLYWHPLGGGMPDSSIRIGVEFEVGGCYEDWGFVIEQNGRTISSGRTLKEAISKLKDSK